MSKRYLVKSVCTATEENKTFRGQVHEYWNGKGDELLAVKGNEYLKRELWNCDIVAYGYKRICDAKRCYSYKNPQNDRFWKTVVSIEEFDV